MPFYEYECSNCKFYAEVMQKISDAPLRKCPSCGKSAMKKLLSAPVFRLKGSGWYETDFKSDKDNQRNLAGGEKDEAKSDAKAADAKTAESGATEAKPADAKAAEGKASEPKPGDAKAGEAKPTDTKRSDSPARAAKRGSAKRRAPKPAARKKAAKARKKTRR
jgi:putative FmdB family regulatory protein